MAVDEDQLRPDIVVHRHPGEGPQPGDDVSALSINTIRALAIDAVEAAGSGHPGAPMALAPLGHLLFTRFVAQDPTDPGWPDRDRFVLSAGHASMLLYALLHLSGYDLPLDELKRFRRLGSRCPGNPERGVTPGVEVTTGPLGQGFANAVGLAIAERMLAQRYNRPGHDVVDHRTYVICSDGDLMEGVSAEAASLAGNLPLGKLIAFYDDNHITIEGATDLAFCERVGSRFDAYGWHVCRAGDVNDLAGLEAAVTGAIAEDMRPSLVIVESEIGYGAPTKAGTAAAHGAPLGAEEARKAKRNLGWPYDEPFVVPHEVRKLYEAAVLETGRSHHAEWRDRVAAYAADNAPLAEELLRVMRGDLPPGWDDSLPSFADDMATRVASSQVLNTLAARLPELVGGSADLAPSTDTYLAGSGDVSCREFGGRNFHFGVREHAMGSILNGMAAHGGLRPFGGTFLVFSDYMRPAIRMAALMGLPIVYLFTHDSIGLGEDGPTHQPVEQLASLRAIPGLAVLRPADANETAAAWRVALARGGAPTVLVLTRQTVPTLPAPPPGAVARGAYVRADGGDIALVATGSEVHLALAARDRLAGSGFGARVVSMPSWELFDAQPASYRDDVLLPSVPRLGIEAGGGLGWCRYVDDIVSVESFGRSAPAPDLFELFGFTPEHVARRARPLIGRPVRAARPPAPRGSRAAPH
jgi:transketolase